MKSKAAKRFLEERYDAGRRCFGDLTQEEREIAAGHIIAGEGAMEANEVMTDGDCDTLGSLFGRYLVRQSQDDAEAFLTSFRKDVANRYENRIDALFEEIHDDALNDAKFNPSYDKDETYYQLVRAA